MAKRSLSALLETSIAGTPDDQEAPPPPSVSVSVSDAAASETPAGGPRYLGLDRKELRIRGDQADDLAALTRRLNRARKSEGERITDNTLIRVAIDLLMRDRDRLRGATESDLLKSVLPD